MKKETINKHWIFYREGNVNCTANIDLPHDAMILEKRDPTLQSGNATGFFPGGKYIYIKNLFGKLDYKDQTIIIEFEGIYMNSIVLLNGEMLGGRIYGYSNFFFDLSGKLKIGDNNELKVIVDNSMTPNTRWYSGSGIYRNVNLWIGGCEYIKPEGLHVNTISYEPAKIEVSVDAITSEDSEILLEVLWNGNTVATADGMNCILAISNAMLWSAEHPYIYK